MSDTLIIRPATPDDAPVLADLNRAFNNSNVPAANIAAQLRASTSSEIVLIAQINGQPAGFTCVQISASICYPSPWAELTECYVVPKYRRRGLATALVREAERQARLRGATEIVLLTGVRNTAGQALYSALGYTRRSQTAFQKILESPE